MSGDSRFTQRKGSSRSSSGTRPGSSSPADPSRPGKGRPPAGRTGRGAASASPPHGRRRRGPADTGGRRRRPAAGAASRSRNKAAGRKVAGHLVKAGVEQGLNAALDGVSAGTARVVKWGAKAGYRVGRRIGWGKVVLLLALPNLIGLTFIVLVVGVVATTLAQAPGAGAVGPSAVPGIPPVALDAYNRAATAIRHLAPACRGVTWSLLAAIGKVESDHGQGPRHDHVIAANGDISPPFIGPRLDGSGVGQNYTPVYDTDNGAMDGDTTYDRAVGPMQFMPGTWKEEGHDGNGDGRADPQNYYDAVLSTAVDLCGSGHADLTDRGQLYAAVYRYNHSHEYVEKVMRLADDYARQGQMALVAGPAGSGAGQAVVNAALRWLGTPYLWGGGTINGPTTGCAHGFCGTGFDCSGLTTYALYQGTGGRINVGSYTVTQFNDPRGVHVPWEQMRAGDLVFFDNLDHVGIYMGEGRFVHAPHTGDVVRVSSIAPRRSSFAGAVRYV